MPNSSMANTITLTINSYITAHWNLINMMLTMSQGVYASFTTSQVHYIRVHYMFAIHRLSLLPHLTKYGLGVDERMRNNLAQNLTSIYFCFVKFQFYQQQQMSMKQVANWQLWVVNSNVVNSTGSEIGMLPVTTVGSQHYRTSKVDFEERKLVMV